VDAARAMRVVYVDDAAPSKAAEAERASLARERAALDADRRALESERTEAAEDLARRRADLDREAEARTETLAAEWIAASLERGAALLPVARRGARSGGLELTLAEAAFTVGRRGFLRCSLRNGGSEPVTVASAELSGGSTCRAAASVTVAPGATSTFVLAFDGEPSRDATLRLLNPSGSPLVTLRPFR